ncbi:MAG: acyltransferase [Ignavibacteria bacterium]
MAFLSRQQLDAIGFATVGENVLVSERASFHNPAAIRLGSNVRIDDFCVLSAGAGGIEIGDFVHVAVYTSLIGAGRILLSDFTNLSSRVAIYSSNDDYSGATMTNPMVPAEYKNVTSGDVVLEKHVIVGSGSVVLPNVTLHQGAAVAALSLVAASVPAFTIVGGVPARAIKKREDGLLALEEKLRQALNQSRNP